MSLFKSRKKQKSLRISFQLKANKACFVKKKKKKKKYNNKYKLFIGKNIINILIKFKFMYINM
jgi:hypothetical protein